MKFEITKTTLGDSEVFLLKCLDKNTEKVLKSSTGMGDWIKDQLEDKEVP